MQRERSVTVATRSSRLGRLRNNGRLVRISSAARSSVSSDDVPHPLEREDVA